MKTSTLTMDALNVRPKALYRPEFVFPAFSTSNRAKKGMKLVDLKNLGFIPAIAGGAPVNDDRNRGYNAAADLVTQTTDGVDLNELWDEYQQTVAMANAERQLMIDFLTFPVTDAVERVAQVSGADFEKASEYGEPVGIRPAPMTNLVSQKMGIHEWSYDNDTSNDLRFKVPWAKAEKALASIRVEVELGFDAATAFKEAERCLNCDVQTVFNETACIECDACVDICPMDCITFTENGEEEDLRLRLKAPSPHHDQALYVAEGLKTGRVMVKDEDVCLHCGLCAERCPTGAWDMQKFLLEMTTAGPQCRDARVAPKQELAV
jgi:ferredoxin